MKIGFNFLGCGMGNNGGTRTIVKCNNTLKELGYKSCIITNIDNFTWLKHDKPFNSIPTNLDVLIATGCTTVNSTLKSNAKKKIWYIRAHENWSMSDEKLQKLYTNKNIIKVCNSNGMRNKVISMGGENVHVVYQGIDFSLWGDLDIRKTNRKKVIGCLYSGRSGFVGERKKWSMFRKLAKRLGNEYEYVGFGDTKCNDSFLKTFKTKPTPEELKRLYSSCDIWFAPTISEGLHNPPLEANLCGCLVVCNDNDDNGMIHDFAFKDKTAMVYSNLDEAIEMIKSPKWEYVQNMQKVINSDINTREHNMQKFISILKEQMRE